MTKMKEQITQLTNLHPKKIRWKNAEKSYTLYSIRNRIAILVISNSEAAPQVNIWDELQKFHLVKQTHLISIMQKKGITV